MSKTNMITFFKIDFEYLGVKKRKTENFKACKKYFKFY